MRKNFETTLFLRILTVFAVSFFVFHFSLFTVFSHRFHTTLTRIDYNEKAKIAEISIQMFTHDLNQLFESKLSKKLDLEKKDEVKKILFEYLVKNFVLKDKTDKILELRWVGIESDADSLWVYIEANMSESPENFKMQNSLFFESYQEQSNLVVIKFDGKKADLAFKVGDNYKEIKAKVVE